MCKYHTIIIVINNKEDNQNKFSFEPVTLSDIVKEIKDINPTKSSTKDSITPKMLKISSEATANILQKLLNESLETSVFLTNELRVTSYYLLHELRVTFHIQVTSYYLLNDLQINFYVRVTIYYLLHELRVKFVMRVTSYYLLHQFRLIVEVSLLYQLFISMACFLQNQLFLVSYS